MTITDALFLIGGILIGYGAWWFKDWLEWRSAATIEGEFDPPIVIPAGGSVDIGIAVVLNESDKEIPEST